MDEKEFERLRDCYDLMLGLKLTRTKRGKEDLSKLPIFTTSMTEDSYDYKTFDPKTKEERNLTEEELMEKASKLCDKFLYKQ